MSVNPITPDVFQGGQMTDLPVFSGTLDGTELMEIVAAPSGQTNEAAGVNYQITTLQLALLLQTFGEIVVIGNGQYNAPGNPFTPGQFVGRIYINKSVAEATYITFNLASTYLTDVLVKDVAGTVDDTHVATVAFTSGQTADGNATVPIQTPYGGYFFRPISSIGKWTLGSA